MTTPRETIGDIIERLKPLTEFERERELYKLNPVDASTALFISHALSAYDDTKQED